LANIAEGLIWYIAFLFSTTFHEAAHAFASMRLGDRTAYYGGQVSLDPIPHIRRSVFGMVVFPILSFLLGGWMVGWASTPYNPRWAYTYPKRSAVMSLAGPTANFILMVLAALFIHLGIRTGIFVVPERMSFPLVTQPVHGGLVAILALFISILFTLNLILLVFNLIPLPPLDGSGVVPLLLGEDKARAYMDFISNPVFMIFGLFLAWKIFAFLFSPLYLLAINLLYPGHNYLQTP